MLKDHTAPVKLLTMLKVMTFSNEIYGKYPFSNSLVIFV